MIAPRRRCALLLALPLLITAGPARADFSVYCIGNSDGTSSCDGWRGGEQLTCVGSPGGVSTCSAASGQRFTCVMQTGGVTSCADAPANGAGSAGTACTFTGDGSFQCRPPAPRSEPLLPGPALPSLPDSGPVITDPSVFSP